MLAFPALLAEASSALDLVKGMPQFLVPTGATASLGRTATTWSGADGLGTTAKLDVGWERDQQGSTLAGLMTGTLGAQQQAPIAAPFRFEAKRIRIDWRLLHGIDASAVVRDVDLDTLERVVGLVAFGDIEAEDLHSLSETNFIKVFRLAQLVVEYLLYVQDSLQASNAWLQSDRARLETYIQAVRLRLRELDAHYKTSRRELRRARRTVKTYEAMAALGKLPGPNTTSKPEEPNDNTAASTQQHKPTPDPTPSPSPLELALQQEMVGLAERLSRTQLELSHLRADREELAGYVRDIDAAVKATARSSALASRASMEPQLLGAREQLARVQTELRVVKSEKEELSRRLGDAQAEARVLKEEKQALLTEISTRGPSSSVKQPEAGDAGRGGGEPSDGAAQLSTMLLDAEARNKALGAEVAELQTNVTALQKQLMRAAKDAAKDAANARPDSGPVTEQLQRALTSAEAAKAELTARVKELEREASERRAAHDAQLRALQEQVKQQQQQQQQQQQAAPADRSSSDGALEAARQEQAALQAKVAELMAANTKLAASQAQKDKALAAAWKAVRELQAQLALPAANRDPGAVGKVKAQVKEFELLAAASGAAAPSVGPSAATDVIVARQGSTGSGASEANNASFKFAPAAASGAGATRGSVEWVGATPPPATPPAPVPAPAPRIHVDSSIKARLVEQVAGLPPAQLAQMIDDEMRILTEHPYEYEGDEEAQFRSLLPHELPGGPGIHPGTLSARRHTAAELVTARARQTNAVLDAVDRTMATYGVDPAVHRLTDVEYAAVMKELERRRQDMGAALSPEAQEHLEMTRDRLLTHLELAKRRLGDAPPQYSDVVRTPPPPPLPVPAKPAAAPASAPSDSTQRVTASAAPSRTSAAGPGPSGSKQVAAAQLPVTASPKPPAPRPTPAKPDDDRGELSDKSDEERSAPVPSTAAQARELVRKSSAAPPKAATSPFQAPASATAAVVPSTAVKAPLSGESSDESDERTAPGPGTAAEARETIRKSSAAPPKAAISPFQSPVTATAAVAPVPSTAVKASTSSSESPGIAGKGILANVGSPPLPRPEAVRAAAVAGVEGSSSPTAKRALEVTPLNQSLTRAAGAAAPPVAASGSLAASLGRQAQLVTVSSASALNMSLQSLGKAKPSARDYAAMEDSDSEDDPMGGHSGARGHDRASKGAKASDEYAVDEDEAEQVDAGVEDDDELLGAADRSSETKPATAPPPAADSAGLPQPGAGWGTPGGPMASLRGGDNKLLPPSRLAKASAPDEGKVARDTAVPNPAPAPALAPQPNWLLDSDVSEDNDSVVAKSLPPPRLIQPAAAATEARPIDSAAQVAPAGQGKGRPRTSQTRQTSSWLDSAGVQEGGAADRRRTTDSTQDAGSVHSFNPNSTSASMKVGAAVGAASVLPRGLGMPGTAAAMHAAWGSPNATARSRAVGPTGPASVGQWSEGVHTLGSSSAGDELTAFREAALNGSLGRGPGVASSPTGGAQAAVAARLAHHNLSPGMQRQNTFDTVSDIELP